MIRYPSSGLQHDTPFHGIRSSFRDEACIIFSFFFSWAALRVAVKNKHLYLGRLGWKRKVFGVGRGTKDSGGLALWFIRLLQMFFFRNLE